MKQGTKTIRILLALALALAMLLGNALPGLAEGTTYEGCVEVYNGEVYTPDVTMTGSPEDGWTLDGSIDNGNSCALDVESYTSEQEGVKAVCSDVKNKFAVFNNRIAGFFFNSVYLGGAFDSVAYSETHSRFRFAVRFV